MTINYVGVVGLGGMGKALSESLVAAEHAVTVWDRHTDRVATTAMIGASPSVSPRQLASQSEVIFLALPHAAAVREVLYAEPDGLLAGVKDDALIIDMTTGDPTLAAEVAERVAALNRGVRYVDAPVSGKAPQLTVMIGGAAGVLGEAEAVVQDIAKQVLYAGRLGEGFAVKLIHQHVKYATHLAVSEALLLASKLNLDMPTVIEALRHSTGVNGGQQGAIEFYESNTRAMAKRAPSTTIKKDLDMALALADEVGMTSSTLSATAAFFTAAVERDYQARPYPEASALLEELTMKDGAL
ncbi:NAD(P)-dependent oxidoreductase [Cryobacterium sp. Hh7]|uniref:NAD(P)-dependent oxidoreductase n=1 Tax=Cryobacterium sp. Hh7 TaxID=1259159 RepID=UPI00106C5400|nr:NAD(P)-dependent oxidoreductase [Cryobacterium sp. Hh7]TFD61300.1 NAD(P)-dependent oxidoreductase [Cryobacterium sp. Hh7]